MADMIDRDAALKPCPFCGDPDPYTDEESCRIFGKRTGHSFAVACSNCEVSAPGGRTMKEAIAAWNRRAIPAAQADYDARIRSALTVTPHDPAKVQALVDAASRLLAMVDDLKTESGRGIDYGEEDAFRMGEWFDDEDISHIEKARAALAAMKEGPTEYERKVAQMKEDFPNGI